MLHSKYGSCSINHPWAKGCNIYYMILKNVTVCLSEKMTKGDLVKEGAGGYEA